MLYVIDAGVVVKWFIPEDDSDIAHELLTRYLQGLDTLIAPDLLVSECSNVFWRRQRQGDITLEEATESMADLLALNIPLTPASSLVHDALQLAIRHERTVYDSLYLTLSEERNCPVITADERFFNAVGAEFPNLILLRNWQQPAE